MSSLALTLKLLVYSTILMASATLAEHLSGMEFGYLSREGRPITLVSIGLILGIAWICREIHYVRFGRNRTFDRNESTALWGVLACCFLYLVFDESFRFHETIDRYGHKLLGADPDNPITDRLDDAILGMYGIGGIWILYKYREEFLRFKSSLPYVVAAFAVTFLMVIVDAVGDGKDVIHYFFQDPSSRRLAHIVTFTVEEYLKLIGESLFVGAFYHCLLIARSMGKGTEQLVTVSEKAEAPETAEGTGLLQSVRSCCSAGGNMPGTSPNNPS